MMKVSDRVVKKRGLKGSISSKGSIYSDHQPIELIEHFKPFEQNHKPQTTNRIYCIPKQP